MTFHERDASFEELGLPAVVVMVDSDELGRALADQLRMVAGDAEVRRVARVGDPRVVEVRTNDLLGIPAAVVGDRQPPP